MRPTIAITFAVLALAVPAQAQNPDSAKAGGHIVQAKEDFIGRDLRTTTGQEIGEVKDLIADLAHRRVVAVVFSVNDLQKGDEDLRVLPWTTLALERREKDVVTHAPVETLKTAFSFPEKRWPSLADTGWIQEVYRKAVGANEPRPTPGDTEGTNRPRRDELEIKEGAILARVSELVGADVRNSQGEDLGEVEELALDSREGFIRYAVLSFGGILGLGEKLFAIPIDAMNYNREEKRFLLNVDKEKLKKAPGFDKKNWPDMANPTWISDIDRFYGTESGKAPSSERRIEGGGDKSRMSPASPMVPGSEIDDYKVVGSDGREIGDVKEVAIDLADGRVAFIVLSLKLGNKEVVVPPAAFKVDSSRPKTLVVDVPEEKLASAPTFDKARWNDLSDRRLLTDVYKYFGHPPYWR